MLVTINAPLHPETEGLFDDKLIGMMKRGSYIVNTAARIAGVHQHERDRA